MIQQANRPCDKASLNSSIISGLEREVKGKIFISIRSLCEKFTQELSTKLVCRLQSDLVRLEDCCDLSNDFANPARDHDRSKSNITPIRPIFPCDDKLLA